jgi:streptogramin lyase
VFIFDKNCDPKGGYIGTGVDKDFDPRDICCNSKGNIIISDFTNNVIHILDQDGNVERLLNTASHDLRQPVTIATDVNDRIWVTFNDGNIIIIKYP